MNSSTVVQDASPNPCADNVLHQCPDAPHPRPGIYPLRLAIRRLGSRPIGDGTGRRLLGERWRQPPMAEAKAAPCATPDWDTGGRWGLACILLGLGLSWEQCLAPVRAGGLHADGPLLLSCSGLFQSMHTVQGFWVRRARQHA
jgi:hypothetical protein